MKQYIKDGKIYNSPIKIKVDGKIIYTNNEKVLIENGFEEFIPTVYKPTLDELIEKSNEEINSKTDEKILNDFEWNGNEFYLTMENQFNFKTLYDLIDFQTFPITVKTKTGFTQLNDRGELSGFYLAGVSFIEKCIKDGWEEKLEAENRIRETYE